MQRGSTLQKRNTNGLPLFQNLGTSNFHKPQNDVETQSLFPTEQHDNGNVPHISSSYDRTPCTKIILAISFSLLMVVCVGLATVIVLHANNTANLAARPGSVLSEDFVLTSTSQQQQQSHRIVVHDFQTLKQYGMQVFVIPARIDIREILNYQVCCVDQQETMRCDLTLSTSIHMNIFDYAETVVILSKEEFLNIPCTFTALLVPVNIKKENRLWRITRKTISPPLTTFPIYSVWLMATTNRRFRIYILWRRKPLIKL
jgi:hypothetical protein